MIHGEEKHGIFTMGTLGSLLCIVVAHLQFNALIITHQGCFCV